MHALIRLIAFWLASTVTCIAATPAATAPRSQEASPGAARGPSLELSLEAAQTAIATCKALGANVAVSVIDSAGVVKLVLASDGTFELGVTSSLAKAVTARELDMPVREVSHKMKTDSAFAAKMKANPKYINGQGGLPLRVGNEVIGAIGVGGGHSTLNEEDVYPVVPGRDERCAQAALDKISARLK